MRGELQVEEMKEDLLPPLRKQRVRLFEQLGQGLLLGRNGFLNGQPVFE